MPIEPLSSVARGIAANRPPDPAPDARVAVEEQNSARRIAEASQGASPQYASAPGPGATPAGGGTVDPGAVANDPEGSIQRAQTLIETASSNGAPSEADIRRAAEAYRTVSTAQDQLARQQQGNGARTTDVLA